MEGGVLTQRAQARGFSDQRQQKLIRELSDACRNVPGGEMRAWAQDIGVTLGRVTLRRGKNIAVLGRRVATGIAAEIAGLFGAYQQGRLSAHIADRGNVHGRAVRDAVASAGQQLSFLQSAIKENPSDVLPRVIVGALAFAAASGGPDGDGGIPDLDLSVGIGAHRSIFSHSIIAGAVVETLLFAVASGIGLFYRYLPSNHDPVWNQIARNKDHYLTAAAQGAGAGIAYHLFVDATVQPAAFHGLPIEMPMEGHEILMGANAAVEALDVTQKKKTFSKRRDKRNTSPSPSDTVARSPAATAVPLPGRADRQGVQALGPERRRHKALAARRMKLDDRIKSCLLSTETSALVQYGHWLNALDTGALSPITPAQEHFVSVCRGGDAANTDMEKLWLKYRDLRDPTT